jgi:hypothetical protein
MRMGDLIRNRRTGTTLKLVLLVLAVAFIGYRVKFAAVPVIAHAIRRATIVAEVRSNHCWPNAAPAQLPASRRSDHPR